MTQQRAVILLKKLNGLVHITECVMSFIIFHVHHRHHHHHQFLSLLSIALVKWQEGMLELPKRTPQENAGV